MDKTEKQTETTIMDLGDVASKLGDAIVAAAEYQAFNAAEQHYQNDSQARELLGQFQEEQRTVQLMQQLRTATAEDAQRLEDLQKNVEANETLAAYFDAQEKLVALLRELNEFISGQLNMDFAELTKPQRGCCG
jgi:cell fate (sporulation/competence/biofilm development) regulator YlbF (YheA/YmcA/DUF963 family)